MLSVSISPLSSIGGSFGSGSFGPAHRIDPITTTLSGGGSSLTVGSPGTIADPAPVVHRSEPAKVGAPVKTGSVNNASAATSPATTVTLSPANTGVASARTVNAGPSAAGAAASSAAGGSSSAASASKSSSSAASSISPAVSIALEEQELMDSFSTTVRGKQYAGSVVESAGEYTASVAAVTGASATASLVQAAESGLVARINELV